MPGIVGIISNSPGQETAATVGRMLAPLKRDELHRSGVFSDLEFGLTIGWSTLVDSKFGNFPVWNESRDICIVVHGECFLGQSGGGVDRKDTDARDLLRVYEEFGTAFLEGMDGWFSGVVVDRKRARVVLFNDRYGLQRIYWHQDKSGTYFASEAKALFKAIPSLRQVDFQSLGELVSCGCPLQGRSLFQGIALLPPASKWVFEPNCPAKKDTYFRAEKWESQPILSHEEFYQKLKETFQRTLSKYLHAKRPIGMSLTGGIDGRMIMAWAQQPPQSLPSYTFGGSYRDCADVRIARKVATACHQSHKVIPIGSEFFKQFPDLAAKAISVSDGAMDITGSAELFANRLAREIAPIRLTGNYGSEILRGNVAFGPDIISEELFDPAFNQQIKQADSTYADETRCHAVSFIAFKQVPWFHYARFSTEQAETTPRSPFLDSELVALMYQAPRESIQNPAPSLRLIAEGNEALARIPTDRGLVFRPTPVLTWLRHAYQEFTARAEYAYDYGMPQWLARVDRTISALRPERLFLGRHKFCHFRIWYRDKLSGYVKDMLLDSRSRGRSYLRGDRVESLVTKHVEGRGNFTQEIHRLLALELIHRELIELN